ncbi:MAG: hypothetical protein CMO80_02440 [Verrucomicrobiales bacterium]|nr:hypothetical protein [Verrucomicrobiales bacterium]|tara:strand:- start:1797 stop:3329 length:1533 start_codon:yes stop_codon:yes gene_type:complete
MQKLFLSALIAGIFALGTGCSTDSGTATNVYSFNLGAKDPEAGFVSLFDGETLNGWELLGKKGDGYGAHNGILFCTEGGGGMLLSEKEYQDFILRFEFLLQEGGNNGVAIRAPKQERGLAYEGMELQIIDHNAAKNIDRLRPTQFHGSIYDAAPAKRGALNPPGEWNEQEIHVRGRRIKVTLNGKVILNFDINSVKDPSVIQKHPGLFRERGHIGFMGHRDFVQFRNIRIRELPVAQVDNRAPDGFRALFNGRNLEGWNGAVNPREQIIGPGEKVAQVNQQIADVKMNSHWSVADRLLLQDGEGSHIIHDTELGNGEIKLDYKLTRGAQSGVVVRGATRVLVQDRESFDNPMRHGSGGLHDGRFLYQAPKAYGDHFSGDWNRMHIILAGDRAHVYVNDTLVVKNAKLRDPDNPGKAFVKSGAIGLLGGQGKVFFRSFLARNLGVPKRLEHIEIRIKPKQNPEPTPKPPPPVQAQPRVETTTTVINPRPAEPAKPAKQADPNQPGKMKLKP